MDHRIKVKIYYEDTDAGGVVYYANYLRYMERARTEFLAEHGINVAEHHHHGNFFVVTHVDIRYKRPAAWARQSKSPPKCRRSATRA